MGVESVSLQERLERWAQRLQSLTVSPLTRDYPDNQKPDQVKRVIEAFESFKLSKDAQLALQKLSGPSSSGFIAFLAAYVVLVARLTGDEDIAIGTSSSEDGRPFVLRVSIDPSDTFLQLYGKVEKVNLQRPNFVFESFLTLLFFFRLSMKVLPTSCRWAAFGPISKKSPTLNDHRSFSVLLPTKPPLSPKITRPIPSKRPIW